MSETSSSQPLKKERFARDPTKLIELNQDWLSTLRSKLRAGKITELEKDLTTARAMAALQLRLDRAEERATTDPLTRLRNRGAFNRRYEAMTAEGRPFGALLLDIDHFKNVNDGYGHPAGDSILYQVGMTIEGTTRQLRPEDEDMVARYGGEEIVVLFPGLNNNETLFEIAEKIRLSVVSNPFSVSDKKIPVTVSIGGGIFSRNDKDSFFHNVDAALYQAKDGGRNRTVIHERELKVA